MAIIIGKRANLDAPIKLESLYGVTFTTEAEAHQFVVRCEQKGQELTLAGTISAKFVRADGNTVQLVGSISDGAAVVTLAQDCYNVPGRFQLAIFNTVGDTKLCIYACVGTVQRAQSGNLIDGGDIIPDVEDLIADIQAAVQSIPPTYDALLASIAGTYSASKTYAVGDYVWYDGSLYRCTTAITTAEAWTSGHWTAAVLGNDVSVIKSAINEFGVPANIREVTGSNSDLDITDERGNVIVRFEDGHIQTKEFDSKKRAEVSAQSEDQDADFYLADKNGNGLVRFADGNIQTKRFNSDQSEYKKTFEYDNTSGSQTINHFFPKGTALVFHLVQLANGSENIDKSLVTYSYTGRDGTEHSIGKDSGYNYLKCVLPEDAVSVSVSYRSGLLWGYTGTLVFSVFSEASYKRQASVITLGANKEYTSLRQAVEAVAPYASDFTPYEIHVYPGTYNVLSDYTADEIANSDFVGLMLTNGLSIIGIGSREEIIITGSLDTETYNSTKRNQVSTLNIRGNVKLENITVVAENIRYAVHDDFISASGKINNRILENVKMYGINLTTGDISYGAGGGNYKRIYARNCDFVGTFLVHNSNNNSHSMKVYLENCSARMFSFPDYNAVIPTNVYLRNCKAVIIGIATIDGPHDQSMFVEGEGTCGALMYCPNGYVYNTGDCVRIDEEQIPVGYAVRMKLRFYSKTNSNIEITSNINDIYGISIGTDGSGTIIQRTGFISSNTLGISGLSVGDLLTIDSNGAIVSGGTSVNAVARVIFVDESNIAYAKLLF